MDDSDVPKCDTSEVEKVEENEEESEKSEEKDNECLPSEVAEAENLEEFEYVKLDLTFPNLAKLNFLESESETSESEYDEEEVEEDFEQDSEALHSVVAEAENFEKFEYVKLELATAENLLKLKFPTKSECENIMETRLNCENVEVYSVEESKESEEKTKSDHEEIKPWFEPLPKSDHEEEEQSEELFTESDFARIERNCEAKLYETLRCKLFLNKNVRVQTSDSKIYYGVLKFLDPLSGDMIIAKVSPDDPNEIEEAVLCFQEQTVSVTLLDIDNSYTGVCKVKPYLTNRLNKNRLINWFLFHKRKVYLGPEDSIILDNITTIKPPYRPEDCYCDEPRVLEVVKKMVKYLPFKKKYNYD